MRRSRLFGAAVALLVAASPAVARAAHAMPGQRARVLLVCNGSTTPCPAGQAAFGTVQAAVDAARPGDWVLIWPGVYHEKSAASPSSGVWIGTPDIHIRGLDRNKVIIDGSNGTASHPCPSEEALQDTNGGAGRDGIVVAKASGVTIDNLTVCDYLSGTTGHGNEIWWNGGDGSGVIGMGSFHGSYLTATSDYGPADINNGNLAQYGIFVSNASGPGQIDHSYASNMADAAYYVGACQQECNTVLTKDIGTNSALGYSGTNSGGSLIIKDSVFTENRTGLAPNSLNNDDAPPPQNGQCPGTTKSCLIIEHNLIADNNNANVPTSGLLPAVGTGVEISGGSYDTVRDNMIVDQGAWGVAINDYPDTETPPSGSACQGGVQVNPALCLFSAHGNLTYRNYFAHDGFFGNVTNGDLATVGFLPDSATPRNCFYGNRTASGPITSEPANIESASVDGKPCDQPGTSIDPTLVGQLVCATTGTSPFGDCPAGSAYPQQTRIDIAPLPDLPTMPNPCAGVPASAYCARHSRGG